MNETLESAPVATEAPDPQYQAYVERNSSDPHARPLPYEQWLREEHRQPYENNESEQLPANSGLAADAPEASNNVPSSPGQVNYNTGETQVVVNPTFNNSPNFNLGGQQVVGSGEISGSLPRQIPVTEVVESPVAASASPEQAPQSNPETEALRDEIRQLREQLQQQHDQLSQNINSLTDALREQSELIRQLLEQRNNPPEPEPDPTEPPGPTPTTPPAPTPPGPPEPTPEPGPTPAENAAALDAALGAARDNLLKVTIRRKGRMDDKFTFRPDLGQQDKETYDRLQAEYLDAVMWKLGFLRQSLEEQGKSPEEIRKALTLEAYDLQKEFASREVTLNNEMLDQDIEQSSWKKPWTKSRKLLRKWADVSTKKKILIGVGAGAAVAIISGTAGIGVAGLAAGAAAKFSLGLINRRASLVNSAEKGLGRRQARIDKELQEKLAAILGDNPNALESRLNELIESSGQEMNDDIRKAQRRNKIGNAVMLASGVLIGLGAAGVEAVPSILDAAGGGHHAAVVSTGSGPNSVHQGMAGLFSHGSGHEATVRLPSNMHLGNLNGHDAIFDNNGHVVFNDPNGIWNHQGRLSSAAIQHLRGMGLKVTEGKNYYDPGSGNWHFYNEVS